MTWLIVIGLTVPRAQSPGNGDYGFFTAIADRLRAGDTLYVDVWDNKDPFHFYAIALARNFGVPGAWILEILWIVVTAAAAYLLARRVGLGARLATVVGFALVPLIVLGYPYFMGTSHLPGVALVLAMLALQGSGRPVLAGVMLGLVIFFKLILLPLALVVLVVGAFFVGRVRSLVRSGIAALVLLVVTSIVMLARGELGGFLETQIHNVLYSQSPIVSASYTGPIQKVAQHLVILANPHVAVVGMTSLAVLVITAWFLRSEDFRSSHRSMLQLWWLGASALVMGAITVMVAGKWLHHAEVFVISSTLILILLVLAIVSMTRFGGFTAVVVAAGATYLLAGAPSPVQIAQRASDAPRLWDEANQVDPASQILSELQPVPVMFIGQGNLVPKSGVLGEWPLACRHLAQRQFDPQSTFDETLACLDTASLVVVANDFGPDPLFPAYTEFGSAIESKLASDFACRDIDGFRLCGPRAGA